MPALSWHELGRDLRMARRWCDDIYVHSLEGCVWHGHLERLHGFDWSPGPPPASAPIATGLRRLLQATLWVSAHPKRAALSTLVVAAIAAARAGHDAR